MSEKKKMSILDKSRLSLASITTVGTCSSTLTNHQNQRGLNWIVTALFLVGDLAGGGIVALPTALVQLDFYPGLIISIIMTLAVTYTALLLGESWVMLQRRWPQYRYHCRKPYAEIGRRALGPLVKKIVTVCIDVTQFGVAVVYLLLSSKNIRDFLQAFFGVNFSFCYVVLILALCLLPVIFLKSPQDFWIAVVIAMITTSCAVVLTLIGSALDYGVCAPQRGINHKFRPTNYFLALGTILFSYGGHSTFPTIQHDMKKPYHFSRSVLLAFTIIFFLYEPVCIMGFITYGNSLQSSIINSLQNTGIQQAVNVLITIHCILTLTIVFNPLNQDIEEFFKVPHHFGWQRILLRTSVLAAVVFVAESLPTFGPLLDLFGGSLVALTSLVFPCLFYLYLAVAELECLEKGKDPTEHHELPRFTEILRRVPKIQLILCCLVIVLAVIGGGAATFSAIRELATTKFSTPCYVLPFQRGIPALNLLKNTNCCGNWQNISIYGDRSTCSPYNDFYNQGD